MGIFQHYYGTNTAKNDQDRYTDPNKIVMLFFLRFFKEMYSFERETEHTGRGKGIRTSRLPIEPSTGA